MTEARIVSQLEVRKLAGSPLPLQPAKLNYSHETIKIKQRSY